MSVDSMADQRAAWTVVSKAEPLAVARAAPLAGATVACLAEPKVGHSAALRAARMVEWWVDSTVENSVVPRAERRAAWKAVS